MGQDGGSGGGGGGGGVGVFIDAVLSASCLSKELPYFIASVSEPWWVQLYHQQNCVSRFIYFSILFLFYVVVCLSSHLSLIPVCFERY